MQHEAGRERFDLRWRIERIAQYRMPQALHVHTQLVRSACEGFELNQTGRLTRLHHPPQAQTGFAVGVNDVDGASLVGACVWVSSGLPATTAM